MWMLKWEGAIGWDSDFVLSRDTWACTQWGFQ